MSINYILVRLKLILFWLLHTCLFCSVFQDIFRFGHLGVVFCEPFFTSELNRNKNE